MGASQASRRFLHSDIELGRLHSLGLRRGLRLGLRSVADRFGQHLVQLSLGLFRFAREAFCPCCHKQYVGMPEGVLNPDQSSNGGLPAHIRCPLLYA